VGSAKLGALNLGSMAVRTKYEVRSTKYERRVRSSDDDEERERGVLRPASYTRFDSHRSTSEISTQTRVSHLS
jgi:hypothetical protein